MVWGLQEAYDGLGIVKSKRWSGDCNEHNNGSGDCKELGIVW